jgi:hypothetical protein
MTCDQCGRSFPGSQATQDYRHDRGSDEDNWKVKMMICPQCAAGRGITLTWYVWFFVLIVIGGIIIGRVLL